MSLRYVASCGLLCAALLAGCDDGRPAPGRVSVQVINAAPGFETLTFRRERDVRNATDLSFKGAQAYTYDADTYDFYVTERTLEVTDPGRVWTFAPTLEATTNYTFVLTEVGGEVQPVVMSAPAAPASSAQFVALHAASGLPALDLYLEAPGVGIAGATPRATFSAQEQVSPRTLPAGDYELFLTPAGNPSQVLLTSVTLTMPAATTSTFVVVAENGASTAQLSVVLLQASPVVLFDRNAPSELRVVNGATDQAPRDVAVNAQFSPPLFQGAVLGEPTPYASVPVGTVQIQVTPPGDPGVLELDVPFAAFIGQRSTMLFTGPAGTLVPTFVGDDGRRLNREAKLRLMNAASQFLAIDYVVTFADGDPNVLPALAQLFPGGASSYLPFAPGEYDLYLYLANTATLLSGPTRISVDAGGIYGILSVDGPDTATAGLRFFDDFP
jgi:hypothetical protein